MSQVVQCPGCHTKLRLNRLPPGKRFQCPRCGTKAAGPPAPDEPAVLRVQPAAAPARPPAQSEEPGPTRRRQRRRRQRQPLKWLFQPLFLVGNVAVTPSKLGILAVILAGLSWFLWTRDFFGEPKASVTVVQAFRARNFVPPSDSNRLNDAQKLMTLKMQRRDILVAVPDPQGTHLLVKFTLSGKFLEQEFGNKMMAAHIDDKDVVLQAGDQKLHPVLFLTDELLDRGLTLHYPPPIINTPPASPAPGKESPPVAKAPSSPAKDPPPLGKGSPAQVKEPSPTGKDSPPAAKDSPPAGKDSLPGAKDSPPVAKDSPPAAKNGAPAAKDSKPPAKNPMPPRVSNVPPQVFRPPSMPYRPPPTGGIRIPPGVLAKMDLPRGGGLISPFGKNNGQLTSQPDGSWQFRGAAGLVVDCEVAGAPEYTVHMTWDKKCQAWLADSWADSPMQLTWNWEVICLFPKPTTTENLSLVVLRRPIPLGRR